MNHKKKLVPFSDHCYNWSDGKEKLLDRISSTKADTAGAQIASPGYHLARISDHPIQALRQTWMSMCPESRAWSETLPLGQLSRLETPDRLRAAEGSGICGEIPGQLPVDPRDPRRDLQHQPRAVATTRADVEALIHDKHRSLDFTGTRRENDGRRHRQHSRSAVENRSGDVLPTGGNR